MHFLFLGFLLRNKINSSFYIIPSQRFSSLRNSVNGALEGKIGSLFLRGGGGGGRSMAPFPLRAHARDTGPSLAFHTIGVKGYDNSVQPPPPFEKFLDPPLILPTNLTNHSPYTD